MPRFEIDRRDPAPRSDAGLQRTLAAPVLAAAAVALSGIVAGREFLITASPEQLVGLLAAVGFGASVAAGLFAPRPGLIVTLAVALASAVVAELLLVKVAAVRASPAGAGAGALPPWIVWAAPLPLGAAALAGAAAGAAVRRLLGRPRGT